MTETDGEVTKVSILGSDTIHIGYNLASHIANTVLDNLKSSTYVIISDTNIDKFEHVGLIQRSLEKAIADRSLGSSARVLKYLVAPGEASKNRATKAAIEDWMFSHGCTRDTVVLAIGGGVIGDMIGYVAATFMRGVKFVQIPTTLLAMVDSSIGGKTAIDTPAGKNLLGAFWQPQFVFVDLLFLATLPVREFINGMAEVVKTAAFYDAAEFERLENYSSQFLRAIKNRKPDGSVDLSPIKQFVHDMVKGSIKVKAGVVTLDEREGGLRNLLNFGHTVGHAYEALLTPYILHGECVAVGIILEAEIARYLGILNASAVARIIKCCKAYELPTSPLDPIIMKRSGGIRCSLDDLMKIMNVDKKNDGNKKKIVILKAIGQTYEQKATIVSDEVIRTVLGDEMIVAKYTAPANASFEVTPPGSKSITNRALVLAALGTGTCRIKNMLHSDDTAHMINALTSMKASKFGTEDNGETVVVEGNGGNLSSPGKEVFLGNSGTSLRFLTSVAAIAKGDVTLTGIARMKERPIAPLVDALRDNGCDIDYEEKDGFPPITVKSSSLKGGRIELNAKISSQYVSSVLMCAPYASEPVTLALTGGKPISILYVDMTIAIMKQFGIKVTKSETEPYTYHIPQGVYKNPSVYVIESDASSATYPLAFAALTGTTVTIPNIGSSSLQGDARFAKEVLGAMGCKVVQTETNTTVTGPKDVHSLKAITVDMEPMTDAFLTASVVAAVCQGTTVITGIANQRVKECNRILAMKTELGKFGITCRELEDGLEIDGSKSLVNPKNGVHTYDDHRVAMSFSLLALLPEEDTLIQDRRCVEKTWPGWWDTMNSTFHVHLKGAQAKFSTNNTKEVNGDKTVVVIGMRGAGKTTTGEWIAAHLGLKFIDMDHYMEKILKTPIPEIVTGTPTDANPHVGKGWPYFRVQERELFQRFIKENPTGYVVACGGGVVEEEATRKVLKEMVDNGRIVLHIHRSVKDILSYLNKDESRPAYGEDIATVWKRREPWYDECSNFMFYSSVYDSQTEVTVKKGLKKFLDNITGRKPVEIPTRLSSFLSLTFPDLTVLKVDFDELFCGTDAIELRVDLLKSYDVEFVIEQIGFLKKHSNLPIVFTIRTKSQGGKFPDGDEHRARELIEMAFKLGVEYVDVEISWTKPFIAEICAANACSRLIASHHDFSGEFKWTNPIWNEHYHFAASWGDIVKFVGTAKTISDNWELEEFRAKHTAKPFIAINMGAIGQISRVLNVVLTPVTHPSLPVAAAPGQLSVKQINHIRNELGMCSKQKFYIFGSPVAHSLSPKLHNELFEMVGLPHLYGRFETESADEAAKQILALGSEFGGASVTIPLKLSMMSKVDILSDSAQKIGALNTLIRQEDGKLLGDNTDWKGIVGAFENAGVQGGKHLTALIAGAGGTSRAAAYALHQMGFGQIYITNRTEKNALAVAEELSDYGIKVLASDRDVDSVTEGPAVVMSCVPADKPLDEAFAARVKKVMSISSSSSYKRTVLEAAYKPAVTPFMEMADKELGWKTIPGSSMIVYQGIEQFRLWTGYYVSDKIAKRIVGYQG